MKRLLARSPRARSLRVQLTVLGVIGMIIPLAALVAVVFATEERVDVDTVPDGDDGPAIGALEVETTIGAGVSPLVPLTAAMLAAVVAIGVWWWSGRAVRPLRHIAGVADEIQAGSLERRIGLEDAPTEVATLADSFDRMLHRVATASTTQRQLIENTSHELRTPLAALAATAEVALAAPDPSPEDLRASLRRIEEMTDRLQATIETLLSDARERGDSTGQLDNDLMVLIHRVAAEQRTLTPEVTVAVEGPDRLLLGIDGPSVGRAVANLVANAARFSPPGAAVTLAVTSGADRTEVAVTDEGPGIEPDDLPRIFDRYYQAADAGGPTDSTDADDPTPTDRGHGIGLALVQQVAEAYGGISVESPLGLSGGTRFVLSLPARQD